MSTEEQLRQEFAVHQKRIVELVEIFKNIDPEQISLRDLIICKNEWPKIVDTLEFDYSESALSN
jgi:hypothetical protein